MSRDAADDVKDVKDWGMGEPQKYTAEIILEAETVYENHAEDHREKIREQRRKKSSCIGCFDRLYLKEIPYEAIAKNEAAAELGLDLFEYNLTTDQVNRLRQALSTNTNLPWVEIDWKSLTSDQKNVLLNLKHPMVLENFFIHKYDERPLPKACAEGELDDVRVMVELIDTEIGDVTEAKDKNGKTGAYLAAFNGKDQVVAFLLENGANDKDVHEGELDGMKKKYGNQPFLPKACAEGCYNDVKAAIEKFKENVDESKDKNGKTGAYLAAFNGKDQVVAYLLENGANDKDVHEGELDGMKKKYGNQPFLPKACAEGCYNDVKAAIEKFKENVDESKDKNGKTGAYLAAFNGKDQVVNSRRLSIILCYNNSVFFF